VKSYFRPEALSSFNKNDSMVAALIASRMASTQQKTALSTTDVDKKVSLWKKNRR
jgi:hypothetical protein